VKRDIGSESRFMPTPPAFDAPVRGVAAGILPFRLVRKTRMMGLPEYENFLKICLFVLTKSTNVTDGQTDTARQLRPRLHSIARKKILNRTARWRTTRQYRLTKKHGRVLRGGEKNDIRSLARMADSCSRRGCIFS